MVETGMEDDGLPCATKLPPVEKSSTGGTTLADDAGPPLDCTHVCPRLTWVVHEQRELHVLGGHRLEEADADEAHAAEGRGGQRQQQGMYREELILRAMAAAEESRIMEVEPEVPAHCRDYRNRRVFHLEDDIAF